MKVVKALAWIVAVDLVVAVAYAWPFPSPAKPGVWILPLAALIAVLMAAGAWFISVCQPTPAVQRSRARRQQRH